METSPAAVADLINPQRFFFDLFWIDRIDEAEAFHGPFLESNQRSASATDSSRIAEN